jgi:non-specific serine/threonine protein kinase
MSSSIQNKQHFYRYAIGSYVFDTSLFVLSKKDGIPINVEKKPLEVLAILIEHKNEVLSREELLSTIWPRIFAGENSLTNAIAKLRKALDEESSRVVTHQGIGYSFSGDVETTVIGKRLISELSLEIGHPVPQRPSFRLVEALSSVSSREVWRAKHHKTGETRIFKFASDSMGLHSIQREVTLFRVLSSAYEQNLPVGKVLEWNFETEPFFLECEDAGLDLKRWASTANNLSSLSLEKRIGLGIHICDAVNQVHELGILHRDIKPSNIIIQEKSGEFVIKLIDFGSGFLLDRNNLERFDISPLGLADKTDNMYHTTPIYLAPELIEDQNLNHSIRSDIYSLGMVIYQLITEQLGMPIGSDWQKNIDDPLIKDDIYKATNSNPEERFTSAAELAKNLRGLPLRHQQKTEAEQSKKRLIVAEENARKEKAKRPWIFLSGALLLAGLCISLVLGHFTKQSLEQAKLSAEREEAASSFLVDVINGADPRDSDTGPDASVAESLARAKVLAEERFSEKPLLKSRIYKMLADVYSGLNLPDALDIYKLDAELTADIYGEFSNEHRITLYELSLELVAQGEIKEADELIRQVDILPTRDSRDLNIARLKSKAMLNVLQSNMDEVILYNKELLLLLESPETETERRHRFVALYELSQAYSRIEGKQQLAVDTMAQLLSPDFDKTGIEPYFLLEAEGQYGLILRFNGENDKAERVLKAAIPKFAEFYGEEHLKTIEVNGYLASTYVSAERHAAAASVFAKVKKLACKLFGEAHIRCAIFMGNEAGTRLELRQYDGVVEQMRAALAIVAKQFPDENSPFLQIFKYTLSDALLDLGEIKEVGSLIEHLDVDVIKQVSPNGEWQLTLPILKLRYELAAHYNEAAAAKLNALIDELITKPRIAQSTIDRFKRALIKTK